MLGGVSPRAILALWGYLEADPIVVGVLVTAIVGIAIIYVVTRARRRRGRLRGGRRVARVAQGQVGDRPFGRTVYAIAARGFGGELRLTQDGQTYRVGWREGRIVAADSPVPSDTVGRIALGAGLVNTAQLSDALRAVARGGGGTQLEIIANTAKLDAVRVLELKRQVLAMRTLRVFALETATFELDDQLGLEVDGEVAPLDPLWAIFHGVAAHFSEGRLRKEIEAGVGGQGLRVVEEQIGLLGRFGLDPGAKPLLVRMRKEAVTVAAATAGMGRDEAMAVMAMLYALWCCGCVVGDGAVAVAAPAAAPAPAPPVREKSRPSIRVPAPGTQKVSVAKPAAVSVTDAKALVKDKLALVKAGADHFALLGVAQNVPRDELQKAYLKLAKVLHPDRLKAYQIEDPEVGKIFAIVNQAFAVLGDPAQRQKYVERLARGNIDEDAAAEEMAARLFGAEEAFLRGQAAMRRNQPAAAVPEFKRAVELNPDEGEHLAMLAWAMWCAAGNKETVGKEVRQLLTSAIAMAPRCVPAFFYRGQIAKQQNNLEQAAECFDKVLELDPDHKEAQTEVRLLTSRKQRGR